MKKYLIVRFQLYYMLSILVFIYQTISPVIKDIAFYDKIDSLDEMNPFDLFNFSVPPILLMIIYLWVIIPTVTILKMNRNRPWKGYWYEAVFDREKVYGPIRKFLITNVIIFLIVQICITIERIALHRDVFTNLSWIPLVLFLITFGITSIMSGLFLELRNNRKKYI